MFSSYFVVYLTSIMNISETQNTVNHNAWRKIGELRQSKIGEDGGEEKD